MFTEARQLINDLESYFTSKNVPTTAEIDQETALQAAQDAEIRRKRLARQEEELAFARKHVQPIVEERAVYLNEHGVNAVVTLTKTSEDRDLRMGIILTWGHEKYSSVTYVQKEGCFVARDANGTIAGVTVNASNDVHQFVDFPQIRADLNASITSKMRAIDERRANVEKLSNRIQSAPLPQPRRR